MSDITGLARFIRKPFEVEAVEITDDNIEELATLIGEVKRTDGGNAFIQVDRRLVPNLFRVYPGFWMTKIGDQVRCYSSRVFKEQFVKANDPVDAAVNEINAY